MKTDVEYSNIFVCPALNVQLSHRDMYSHDGTCVKCGHNSAYISHSRKIVGRWVKPSLFERIFRGEKTRFIRKDEADKIMKALKQ